MSQREIGVGVIGFGLGGRVFHAPFVSAVTGLRLAAIMQRTGDAAAKAYPTTRIARSLDERNRERQNIEKVFDSMEDMNYIENYTYKIGFLGHNPKRKKPKKQPTLV